MDTIAAIATAPGLGAVGIVKLAGPHVENIVQELGWQLIPRHARFVEVKDPQGVIIDSGLAVYFPAPHSYTGDTTLEFQGHGGPVVLNRVLNRFMELGARTARPGEFSERAFLNDKLDLAQAEAVADLITAGSEQAAIRAQRSLQGEFSNQVEALHEQLVRLRVYVEASIDFPEEEIDFLADGAVLARLIDIQQQLYELKRKARAGQRFNDGIQIVLVGRPNAGKSSLLNALSGRDAAIVTDIAGTTRDTLTEQINLDGLPAQIIDTAGLRQTDDIIEAEGVKRALAASATADLVMFLTDASQTDLNLEHELAELFGDQRKPDLVVWNKSDLADTPSLPEDALLISAKENRGLDHLIRAIQRFVGIHDQESGFLARTRHLEALDTCDAALQVGRVQLEENQAGELLAEDLRQAHEALGQITGKMTSDDLLGEIFSSFCIGK